ncbi:MAG: hypothetical protein ACYTFT_04880, partial [Planctomycetota bacterium]
MPTAPNLLVRGTTLAQIDRVPPYATELWKRVHRRVGRSVQASRRHLDPLGAIFERLGLALIVRKHIARFSGEGLDLKLHSVMLFEMLGGALDRLGRFVQDSYQIQEAPLSEARLTDLALLETLKMKDEPLAKRLRAMRPALRRIFALRDEAIDPRNIRFQRDPSEPADHLDASRVELGPEGVSVKKAPKRSWLPVDELADLLCADTASAI